MLRNEQGSVVFLALVVTTVLMTMVTASSYMLNNEIKISSYNRDRIKALYLAEAGVEYGRIKISEDDAWEPSDEDNKVFSLTAEPDTTIDWNKISVKKKEKDNGNIVITSIGEANKGIRKKVIATYEEVYSEAFKYVGVAGGQGGFTLNNNTHITGSAYSVGDVSINKHLEFTNNGIIYYGGYLTNNSDTESSHFKKQETTDILPNFDLSTLKSKSDILIEDNVTIKNGKSDYEVSDIESNGITYIDGDLTINNKITIDNNEILVVNGDLIMNNKITFGENDNLVIIVTGSVNANNKFTMNGLLYSGETITFNNKADITGSIMAGNNVMINNNTNIDFDDSYLTNFTDNDIEIPKANTSSGSGFKLIQWKEVN